jgi:hypothetical protein
METQTLVMDFDSAFAVSLVISVVMVTWSVVFFVLLVIWTGIVSVGLEKAMVIVVFCFLWSGLHFSC